MSILLGIVAIVAGLAVIVLVLDYIETAILGSDDDEAF